MKISGLGLAAGGAAGLLLLTLVSALIKTNDDADPLKDVARRPIDDERPATVRCSIYQARFGGQRAQLIKVMRGSVPNYVVVEVGRRGRIVEHQRGLWLRAAFGEGEQTWLGEFGSPEGAMSRATMLCPAALRCGPGEADCGPQTETMTPVKAFLQF